MIKYTLTCAKEHVFESWFQSGDAYEALRAAGHVTCAVCGDAEIDKTVMAPAVSTSLKGPQTPLQALREKVEATSDYVGTRFAKEARQMHDGDIPHRPIYGEANLKEAKSLISDGVPVMPLPFMPRKRTN